MSNPNIKVVGKYKNAKTHILHKCPLCGNEWNAVPNNVLGGTGCPKCSKTYRINHEEYVDELFNINPFNEVIERFVDKKTPIMHHCLIHDKYWKQSPNNALKGCGCSECSRDKVRAKLKKPHEQYLNDVYNINPDIKVIGIYVNNNTPILHKCLLDGNEWFALPSVILSGSGCPLCRESNGERKIRQWLERHNIKYVYQYKYNDCKDINALPFDFYLPDYNAVIEYDGKQHYESINWSGSMTEEELKNELKNVKIHDEIKNKYCKDKNIKLLRIPYFSNIEETLDIFIN